VVTCYLQKYRQFVRMVDCKQLSNELIQSESVSISQSNYRNSVALINSGKKFKQLLKMKLTTIVTQAIQPNKHFQTQIFPRILLWLKKNANVLNVRIGIYYKL